MTKSNIHKALGVAALLGIALLAGCQDVSTDLKPQSTKLPFLKVKPVFLLSRKIFRSSTPRT